VPIHQLFYHRLTGGRLMRFYSGTKVALPGGAMSALPGGVESIQVARRARWVINDQVYDVTLDDLIAQATTLLKPAQAGASIIGHGDAHNGNVFYHGTESALTYFDPAFAGRHAPLLDLTKPLFHNVFAMWMYFRQEKAAQTRISLKREGDVLAGQVWRVEHDYALHPVRVMFLGSKVERVLVPMLQELKRRDWLRADWRAYLKAALLCCPLLTMNLTDGEKFPPEISLLGLAMAVEMGAESAGERSLIDRTLDEVERTLR
jgi:hypothetical protein